VNEFDQLRQDLVDEQDSLDDIVSPLSDIEWASLTPSPGWTVTDQVGHLRYFDGTAALAVSDPEAFQASLADLFAAAVAPGIDEFTLADFRSAAPSERLALWRENRARLAAAAVSLTEDARIPWYGPSMGAKSFVTARLMEAWAHGQDIVDAVGVPRGPTDRLRHIAQLGFITRGWSYKVRGEEMPPGDVRVELTGPSGDTWRWGPSDAADVVTGPALDFCLVVTQRRHVDDTTLHAGPIGQHWLLRAQAFAGGPTTGPAPRTTS